MKSRIVNFVFIALCVLTLLVCVFFSALTPDNNVSSTENRMLTQYKSPTLKTVLDGSWLSFLETYGKDQFFAREIAIRSYNLFLDSVNVIERNGYVLGEDYFVMPVKDFYDSNENLQKGTSYGELQVEAMATISQVADTYGGTVIYMNVPHKTELFTEKYPALYNSQRELTSIRRASIIEKARSAGITVVETFDLLQSHKDEYIYYATDHHWTIRGAYYAYQELLECINEKENSNILQFPSIDKMNRIVNPKRMVGSYLKKLGDSGLINADYMEYLLPYDMPEYTRYDNGVATEKALCNTELSSYASFMGGDIGNTVIQTNRKELPGILYIGCSYSNPLEMMSVYSFDRVESIDPRYWNGSVSQYIAESQPDYIVIIRDDIYEGNPQFSCTVE